MFFCASFFSSGDTQLPASSSLLHGLLLESQLWTRVASFNPTQIDPTFFAGGVFGMQGGVFNDTWLCFMMIRKPLLLFF